jgi:hypothetical protein
MTATKTYKVEERAVRQETRQVIEGREFVSPGLVELALVDANGHTAHIARGTTRAHCIKGLIDFGFTVEGEIKPSRP